MKLVKAEKIAMVELVNDFNVYPRQAMDAFTVSKYYEALKAGSMPPPIKIDAKSKRIVDGWHRVNMAKKAKWEQIDAEFYNFDSEAELLWWSINWNALHGKNLTTYDRARCLNIGRQAGLEIEQIAEALCITVDKITGLENDRVRIHVETQQPVEVKRVLSSITDKTVTDKQYKAQKKFNGMGIPYQVDTVITALANDLFPVTENNCIQIQKLELACQNWLEKADLKQVN